MARPKSRRRHPRRTTPAIASLLWLVACGGRGASTGDESSSSMGGEESSTETTLGETTETGETGEEGPAPTGMCEAWVVDHSADCDVDCPITLDVKIGCDDSEFGDPGLRVAPEGDEGLTLVTSSSDYAWMMSVRPGAELVDTQLPSQFDRKTISLALDPAGEPHLAVDATNFSGGAYDGALTYLSRGGQDFIMETVFDRDDKYIPLFDMEIDELGAAHVWYSSEPPDESTEAVRSPAGNWTSALAPLPGDSGWARFSVTPNGTPVAFDFDDPAGTWYLEALQDGVTTQIGTGWGNSYPGAHVTVAAPALPQLDIAGPDFVVMKEHSNNARIAWPTASGFGEVFVPESEPMARTCTDGGDGTPGSCPETCEETGVGLNERLTSIARTQDGRVWAMWVVTHYDQSLTYQETCDPEIGCYCNNTVEREDSWADIIVGELDIATETLTEVLRVSDVDPDFFGLHGDYRESVRIVDMRSYGTDLALGLRLRGDEFRSPHMRVIRVDTTQIVAP